jgi:hypothetical protein
VKASHRSLRSETIKHLILYVVSDASSANDLNGLYADSEAAASDTSEGEEGIGINLVSTSLYILHRIANIGGTGRSTFQNIRPLSNL